MFNPDPQGSLGLGAPQNPNLGVQTAVGEASHSACSCKAFRQYLALLCAAFNSVLWVVNIIYIYIFFLTTGCRF